MYITNSNLFRYQCLVGGYSFNLYLYNDYLFNICLSRGYLLHLCLFEGYLELINHFVVSLRVSSFQLFSLCFPLLRN